MKSKWDPHQYDELFKANFEELPTVKTSVLDRGVISATRVRAVQPIFGRSAQYTPENSFFVALQLQDLVVRNQWCNGRQVATEPFSAANLAIYDMRDSWSAQIDSTFDVMVWHVSRASLDVIADAHGTARIDSLACSPACGRTDLIAKRFADLLLSIMNGADSTSQLCTGHLLLALHEYLATAYGGFDPQARLLRGGLAPWQLRRVTDFMRANIEKDLTLDQLAHHCSLSVNHFVRAFRVSTGQTPHRWLMQLRLDTALQLLQTTSMSTAAIALHCGFADQSHLSRHFSRAVGSAPGAWRKANTAISEEIDSPLLVPVFAGGKRS